MALLIGFIVSFLGQLPLGFINLIAVKIAVDKQNKNAIEFAFGIALIEMIYLGIVLYFIHWIFDNPIFYLVVQIFTVIVFLFLGIKMIWDWKRDNNTPTKNRVLRFSNDFINGIFLSSINLAQIPFWVLWTSYLVNMKWLTNSMNNYQWFVFGTGLGTVAGMIIYIFGGKYLLLKLKNGNKYLQMIIGIFFIVAALFQVYELRLF